MTVVEAVGARFRLQASALTLTSSVTAATLASVLVRHPVIAITGQPQTRNRRQQTDQLFGLTRVRKRNHQVTQREHPQVSMQRIRRV